MANTYFQFKQFRISQERCAMKVTTDGCLFGAWIAEEIKKSESRIKYVLDIGTGTGLLSLMIAQNNEVRIDGVEIDAYAAQEAKQNVKASPWEQLINIISSDVLRWQPEKKYDAIVCNPPFYENELKSPESAKNIAHHSSELKISQLIQEITQLLSNNGCCFLLIPAKRENEIEKLLQEKLLHINQKIYVHQTEDHAAFRIMLQCSFKNSTVYSKKLLIKSGNDYSSEFKCLLKDYYLYL